MTREDLLVGAVRWRLGGSGGKHTPRQYPGHAAEYSPGERTGQAPREAGPGGRDRGLRRILQKSSIFLMTFRLPAWHTHPNGHAEVTRCVP